MFCSEFEIRFQRISIRKDRYGDMTLSQNNDDSWDPGVPESSDVQAHDVRPIVGISSGE